MKKSAVLVALMGTMILMGGSPSFAQTIAYSFHMSSSFYAGSAKMPAGTYTLRQSQDEPSIYELSNNAGSHSVILETRSSSKASKAKPEILFNNYGGTDYLEAVETSSGNSIDIMPGAAEKQAAKKGSPKPHTVPTA